MLLRRFSTPADRDSGSAIIAVIGVAAVMMIVALSVASLSVNALGFTSSTRAAVQSDAAAESGINTAVVDLRKGNCSVTYSQATAPAYSASVSYSTAASGGGWVANACPPYADQSVQRVRIISKGTAVSRGVAGNSRGNTGSVEAIYGYKPAVLPGIPVSGAAMYFYGGVSFNNNANLIVAAGGPPAIQVKSGDVSCSNNTVIQGDVTVANGNLSINSCTIQGNAWVSGTATLGTITGNLSSANATRPSVVTGTWTRNGVVPPVPAWTSFGYDPSAWKDSLGNPFAVVTPTPDPVTHTCSLSTTFMNTVTAASVNPVTPTAPLSVIIDARLCTSGVTAPTTVTLGTDVAIFAPMYDLSGNNNLTITSSSTTHRKLWFITPDITNTTPPSCGPGQGNFTINNSFVIDSTVAAMLYTPCKFDAKNTFTWYGQMYANGTVNAFKNSTGFTYVGLGLPGVNLADPSNPPPPAAGSPADLKPLIFFRDVN
jgi:hypothetical protein